MLTSFLKDVVIALSVVLGLRFTGLALEWYHSLIILVGLAVYGYKNYWEGITFGKAHAAFLTHEEFDVWLKKHNLTPAEYTKAKE